MKLLPIQKELRRLASPTKAAFAARFFKTGAGQYAEGDVFLGIVVPELRQVAKKFFTTVSVSDAERLLRSKFHEERLAALFILILHFQKGNVKMRERIYKIYLRNTRCINNWDLVDTSAEYIIGSFLDDKPRNILYSLARSKSLWERRIAMLSTFHYIKRGESRDALSIAEVLLTDTHDLIHKAVGWMLREVGKRVSKKEEEQFLKKYAPRMPRTMLRYAIEHFSPTERKKYLLL